MGGAKLGEGSYGEVCRLVDRSGCTGQVVKIVDKETITNYHGIRDIKRQLHILHMLSSEYSHENIIKFHEVYHTHTHILWRMDDGGPYNLFERLLFRDRGDEDMHLGRTAGIQILRQ